jgi:hypothetical protein
VAKLHITEFVSLGQDANGNVLKVGSPATTQVVTFSASTQSAAFAISTTFIRVIADATVHLAFGSDPTATANDLWVPSATAEFFAVKPGHKLAAFGS